MDGGNNRSISQDTSTAVKERNIGEQLKLGCDRVTSPCHLA